MNDDLETRLGELLEQRGKVDQSSVDRVLGGIESLPDRRGGGRARLPLAALAAVVVLAVAGLALATLLRDPADIATPTSPSPSTRSVAPSASPAAVSPTAPASPTTQPRPVWTFDLASNLDCDGAIADFGSDVGAGAFEPLSTPDEALEVARIPYSNIPASGFEPALVDGDWALHRYLVDGRPKVHAVSTKGEEFAEFGPGWHVVGLRACDPSEYADAEFGPEANTIWFDDSDRPVRTDVVTSYDLSCLQRVVHLSLYTPDYTAYLRDPDGDLREDLVVPFDADTRLPSDAIDTGFHTEDWHLFTIPSGRAVFMRTPDGTIELWPRASEPVGCM